MGEEKAEIIIISGANGVGKTTFAKPFVEYLGYKFLNADEIAKKLDDQGFKNTMIKAGRIFFTELRMSIAKRENIVLETTLSGNYINKISKKAKEEGYRIRVIYIFVDSVELCIERVNARVKKGGHDVPEEDIRRRFQRSLNNFWINFTSLSESWILLYNGDENYQQVAIGEGDEYSVENVVLFSLFNSIKNGI